MSVQGGGTYSWDLPLLIPCNAAPYERGHHAKNFWKASAKLNMHGRLVNKSFKTEKVRMSCTVKLKRLSC